MQNYQVWIRGDAGKAQLFGTYKSDSFAHACMACFASFPRSEHHFFDPQALTYWGCRLFDNEADARRLFG